jgi:hypothetical protein
MTENTEESLPKSRLSAIILREISKGYAREIIRATFERPSETCAGRIDPMA